MAGPYQSTDGSFGISVHTTSSSVPGAGCFKFEIFQQVGHSKVALMTVNGAISPGVGKTIKLQADRNTPHQGWPNKKGVFKYNRDEIDWGDSMWTSAGAWWRQQSGM